jgi:4-hydroxy-tetrahydrodipicolinate synthase
MMAVGATGVVSVLSNAIPQAVVDLVKAATDGEFGVAREQHFKLLPLFKACFVDPNPVPIKKYVHIWRRE